MNRDYVEAILSLSVLLMLSIHLIHVPQILVHYLALLTTQTAEDHDQDDLDYDDHQEDGSVHFRSTSGL